MNSPGGPPQPDPAPTPPPDAAEAETTGLPGLRTWRAVYFVVLGSFVLWVVLLFALGVVFR
jgi:hypothetical protein